MQATRKELTGDEIRGRAQALAEALSLDPGDEKTREELWRLRLRGLREGHRLPAGLPEARPTGDSVAARLNCLQSLRRAGLRAIYPEELEALRAARRSTVSRRRGLELHGLRGGGLEGPRPFPFPYRIMERREGSSWTPVALVYEDRSVWTFRHGGSLSHMALCAYSLEEVELEEEGEASATRLTPILEAPHGTDPGTLLPAREERK